MYITFVCELNQRVIMMCRICLLATAQSQEMATVQTVSLKRLNKEASFHHHHPPREDKQLPQKSASLLDLDSALPANLREIRKENKHVALKENSAVT